MKTKKLLSVFLAVAITVCCIPLLSWSAFAKTIKSESFVVPDGAEYVSNEVIVVYEDDVVQVDDTTLMLQNVNPNSSAATGNKFGKNMGKLDKKGCNKAKATLPAQTNILNSSIKNYVVEDTYITEKQKKNKNKKKNQIAITQDESQNNRSNLVVSVVSSSTMTTEDMVTNLKKNSKIKYVQPNYIISDSSLESYNNISDKYYNESFSLNYFEGQTNTHGSNTDSSVHAYQLWDKYVEENASENDDVVVAVVDTGVDYTHPDLADKMWKNPGNIGLDGEYGYDFGSNDDDPMDETGHGTHCAGIIAASGDNEEGTLGIAGLADNIKIMSLKIADDTGTSKLSAVISSYYYIIYAMKAGVNIKVINNSWSASGDFTNIYSELIDQAGELGALSCIASGNDGVDLNKHNSNPAKINSDYAITVAATDENNNLTTYSNYSSLYVDIAAPGTNILSTYASYNYTPNLYSAAELSQTTEYYAEFSADSKISDDGKSVSTTKGSESDELEGVNKFESLKLASSENSISETSLTVDTSNYLTNSDRPASIKLTIDTPSDAPKTEDWVLYFPYDDEEEQTEDSYWNIAYKTVVEEDNGKDALVGVGDIYTNEGTLAGVSMRATGYSVNDNGIWRNSQKQGLFGTSTNKNTVYDEHGVGLLVRSYPGQKITVYIDSAGISKSYSEAEDFKKYRIMSGTSMAAPHVSGAAALISSVYPSSSALDVRSMVLGCITKNDSLADKVATGGYLDLEQLPDPNPVFVSCIADEDEKLVTLQIENMPRPIDFWAENAITGEPIEFNLDNQTWQTSNENIWTLYIKNADALFNHQVRFTVTTDGHEGEGVFFIMDSDDTLSEYSVNNYKQIYTSININDKTPIVSDNSIYIIEDELSLYDVLTDRTVGRSAYSFINEKIKNNDVGLDTSWQIGNQLHPYMSKGIYYGGKIYIPVSFYDIYYNTYSFLLSYDLSANEWSMLDNSISGTMPGDTFSLTSLVYYNGRIYTIGAYTLDMDEKSNRVYSFVPKTSGKPDWRCEENLPLGWYCGQATVYNGKIYAALGWNTDNHFDNTIYVFENEKWSVAGTIEDIVGVESVGFGIFRAVQDGILISGATFEGYGDSYIWNPETEEKTTLNHNYLGKVIDRPIVGTVSGAYLFAMYNDGIIQDKAQRARMIVKRLQMSELLENTITAEKTEASVLVQPSTVSTVSINTLFGLNSTSGDLEYISEDKNISIDSNGKTTIPKGYTGKFGITVSSPENFKYKSSEERKVYLTIKNPVIDTAPDNKITSLTNTAKGISVSWQAKSNITGYKIYRRAGNGSYQLLKTISNPKTTNYVDTSVKSGVTYTYAVRAFKNNVQGTYTAKSILRLDNCSASLSNTSKGITVKWNKVIGAQGYYIYRKTGNGSYQYIKKVGASTLSYNDTSVARINGRSYTYAVKAYYGSTYSTYTAKSIYKLTGPTINYLANKYTLRATVRWNRNAYATGYQILYRLGSTNKYVNIKGNTTVLRNIMLKKGRTYTIYVRSYRTIGNATYYSAWSAGRTVRITK